MATEPSSNKIELTLKTDLKNQTSQFKWAVYNNDQTFIESGNIGSDGSASVTFTPDNSPYFVIGVGFDANNDGRVSKKEYGLQTPYPLWYTEDNIKKSVVPIFNVIAISSNDYDFAYSEVEGLTVAGEVGAGPFLAPIVGLPTSEALSNWKLPFASFLLSTFANGNRLAARYPGGEDAMMNEMEVVEDSINAADSRLSHVAGARFNASSGWSGIPTNRFIFNKSSYPAKEIEESSAFKKFLLNQVKVAESSTQAQNLNNNSSAHPEALQSFTFDTYNPKPEVKFDTAYDYYSPLTQKFDNKWLQVDFGGYKLNATDLDLNVAINNCHIGGKVQVWVEKNNDVAKVKIINFVGMVEDPYDFDYEKTKPAPTAATLQIGWRSSDTDLNAHRKAGKIYITEVDIDATKNIEDLQ